MDYVNSTPPAAAQAANTAQSANVTPNRSDAPMMQSPTPQQPQIVVQPDPDLLNRLEEEKKEKDKIQSELKANE